MALKGAAHQLFGGLRQTLLMAAPRVDVPGRGVSAGRREFRVGNNYI